MSTASTTRLIDLYVERASMPALLAGFFTSPPEAFHATESVEIDVIRDNETVPVVITDLSTGGRMNEDNIYTNKGFVPPLFQEKGRINAMKTMARAPGVDPFQNVDFLRNALTESTRVYEKLERKLKRGIELMASQVLQTGVLTLIDENGTTLFSLDFQMKATHQVNPATSWATDGSTGDPLGVLETTADLIRQDGKGDPNILVFGTTAFNKFLANAKVKAALIPAPLGLGIGAMAPSVRGGGATFQGRIWIGNYQFEMYTYAAGYVHPQTGAYTRYVSAGNVIMLTGGARMILSFGAIPYIAPPDPRAAAFIPARVNSMGRGIDIYNSAYITENNQNVIVECGCRPLTIPVAIDSFAVIADTHT